VAKLHLKNKRQTLTTNARFDQNAVLLCNVMFKKTSLLLKDAISESRSR